MQFSGAVPAAGCETAEQSIDVRDPIVNMVSPISAPVILSPPHEATAIILRVSVLVQKGQPIWYPKQKL